jgi:hypothetical protein
MTGERVFTILSTTRADPADAQGDQILACLIVLGIIVATWIWDQSY